MATLINEPTEDNEGIVDLNQTQEAVQPQETTEETSTEETTLPEKYQGKDITDIIQMHQEAEKALGRQSGEVGELRKVVDDFILQSNKLEEQAQEQAPEIDFFEDPKKAVEQAVSTHPDVVKAREAAQTLQKQTALSQLQQRHPDMDKILTDSKFQEWIKSSPVRQERLRKADTQLDFETADDLFSTWKELQGHVGEVLKVEKENRGNAVRQASTGSAKGSVEKSSTKKFRRADIINLQLNDPDRYQALLPEIRQAYAEKRVV